MNDEIGHAESPAAHSGTARRALIISAIVAVFALLLYITWLTSAVLLLLFAGILFAVVLNGLAVRISRKLPLNYRASVTVVLVILLAGFALGMWLLAPGLAEQTKDLSERLPQALQQLRERLAQFGWARDTASQAPGSESMPGANILMPRLHRMFSSTFGFVADAVVVLFIGLYLAYNPGLYRRGLIRLIAPRYRTRAVEVLDELNGTMWSWAIARLSTMLVVGILTGVGLALLGIPLAFALGLLAGLLDFVPFIGPLLAAFPGILLALSESPEKALYAMLLYLVLQQLEGNVISPLFQQKAVDLPPAVTLASLALFGAVAGILGIFLAEALAAVLMVLVNRLYVEDWLGDRGTIPPEVDGKPQ